MDPIFDIHNAHLQAGASFSKTDPHLRRLASQRLVYRNPLLDALPSEQPGIYTLTGGRQVGKTTLAKQWMKERLTAGIPLENLAFLTGELIDDHHVLNRLVSEFASHTQPDHLAILIVDEVTYIRDWDKAVKFCADAGLLENVALLLTGSDMLILRETRMRLPGRRGSHPSPDFHLHPLSLHETFNLAYRPSKATREHIAALHRPLSASLGTELLAAFRRFLLHGGYLSAINDYAKEERIQASTFATYSDWIRGDLIKRGKSERYLRETIQALIDCYGSQITWNSLASRTAIDHPTTVGDYIELLARMDVCYIQWALREDKLSAAPKKARKVVFTDPFIFHALRNWIDSKPDPFLQGAEPTVADASWAGRLAEAAATSHYRRFYPTYYIKSKGEIDIVYVNQDRFWPVEVKWTTQIRPADLSQARRYPNALIAGKSLASQTIEDLPTVFLPRLLYSLGPSPFHLAY